MRDEVEETLSILANTGLKGRRNAYFEGIQPRRVEEREAHCGRADRDATRNLGVYHSAHVVLTRNEWNRSSLPRSSLLLQMTGVMSLAVTGPLFEAPPLRLFPSSSFLSLH